METHYNIVIAGAGGIAEAAALILVEWSAITPTIYIGNRNLYKARKVADWVVKGTNKPCKVIPFHLDALHISSEATSIFKNSNAILDCLPGSLAPTIAKLAYKYHLHYANLTEYVAETNQIIALAKTAKTGFVLQTGLAPGYINILANFMFQEFCKSNNVDKVDILEFKVGALTNNAVAPHFYGFTWSPVGVATEYIKDCIVIRDFKKSSLPALSERRPIIINGITYEEDLTSGGAADLPDALNGKVKYLDYKTLRHQGHYAWIERQLNNLKNTKNPISGLQKAMQEFIPHVQDDQIILYAAVEGKDAKNILRRKEITKHIKPMLVGKHTLRAIQTTTAAPLVQAIQLLLETKPTGVFLQSELDTKTFLNGAFVTPVYGKVY
ncbi:saccharopine dehydrogenase-like NADP-dependent oxidoreductase [Jejuia pallidilutea]|uniref:Saccharopine dehydrogenase-like NADP-dependent oxidoreductase n=1 Tax=Jejuia pallidilutea TaxID=504487 RepID=A0A362X2H0_9FLAO|nr:saccharopine dehydrogenase C-terminal domain-containing protein [Jejuia pallidilutea]PQV50603.1 saccharopine dehydrogenase-like NADP-dependent oxidoreductase [Jejuia pallidilutea]